MRRHLFLAAVLLWSAAWAAAPAAGQAPQGWRLLEGTAASVNGEVIFLSDLAREACLYRCGVFPGEEPAASSPESVRDRMIADLLVLQEQKKLGLGEVDNGVLAEAAAAGERRAAACADPCARELDAGAVRGFVGKRLLVREFLRKRVSVFVEVTEQEVEAEVARRRSRGGEGAEASPEAVREELLEERTAREIRNWFARAASKSRVVVSPLEGQ